MIKILKKNDKTPIEYIQILKNACTNTRVRVKHINSVIKQINGVFA